MQLGLARRLTLFFALAAGIVVADQLLKIWTIENLTLRGTSVPLVTGWFALTRAHNYGAAWSMLWGQSWLLIGIAVGACVFLTWHVVRTKDPRRIPVIALSCIFAGALGNLIDRLRLGYVVDMFDLQRDGKNIFPIFNVADVGINVGVGLLLLWEWIGRPKKPKAGSPVEEDPARAA